jgi:hypothetical protein
LVTETVNVPERDRAHFAALPGWCDGQCFLNTLGMSITRRALVLTDETAGHPFLRSLPAHVRKGFQMAFVTA